jgi:hypothetical protein
MDTTTSCAGAQTASRCMKLHNMQLLRLNSTGKYYAALPSIALRVTPQRSHVQAVPGPALPCHPEGEEVSNKAMLRTLPTLPTLHKPHLSIET